MSDRERIRVRAASVILNQGGRPCQEDHVMISEEKGIFAVADGFGGPDAGAGAARGACEAIREFLAKEAGDLEATLPFVLRSYFSLAGNVLFNALVHANRRILSLNLEKGVHEKGGASCLAGLLDGDLLALANVGACSAWMLRDGNAAELVVPRSYARLREPFATAGDATLGAPLMALGVAEDLEPEIAEYRLRPGDWLLLHTDGLTPGVRDLVVSLQREARPAGEAAQEAADILKSCSSVDNAGAAVVIF